MQIIPARTLRLLTVLSVFVSVASGQDRPATVEFIVGDYLTGEGGSWDPEQSPLDGPFGIDFDRSDAMYVVELESGALHKITSERDLETLRSAHKKGYTGDGGPISEATFNGPHNCVVSADNKLLIADSWNHCVRAIDLDSMQVSTIAGTGEGGYTGDLGPALNAQFNFTMCIALSPDKQTLHIADLKNRRIRDVDLETGLVSTVAGNGKKGIPTDGGAAVQSPLVDPRAVASDRNGDLYVLERGGHALRRVSQDGSIHTVAGTGKKGWGDGDALAATFSGPKHICCDPAGNVYIADDFNGAIRKYDPRSQQVSTVLGRGFGDQRVTLSRPHGVRWHKGSLYVVDSGHNRLLRVASPSN